MYLDREYLGGGSILICRGFYRDRHGIGTLGQVFCFFFFFFFFIMGGGINIKGEGINREVHGALGPALITWVQGLGIKGSLDGR